MADPTREEAVANRPYRRFVGVMFALAITAICGLLLRIIVRQLDRLPSAAALDRPATVDHRALLACAEDLERLQADVLRQAGKTFGEPTTGRHVWAEAASRLELERLRLVARCHLDAPSVGAQAELGRAADAIEGLIRGYTLLHGRLAEDGALRAVEAQTAIESARRSSP
jgi:hypothetical protein